VLAYITLSKKTPRKVVGNHLLYVVLLVGRPLQRLPHWLLPGHGALAFLQILVTTFIPKSFIQNLIVWKLNQFLAIALLRRWTSLHIVTLPG